jgi:hypothetical protein
MILLNNLKRNNMKRLLLFFGNFLVATIFGWDIMDYYFLDGINIINNDVNRVFIMWLGFTVTVISSCWFMVDHFKYKEQFKNKGHE